MYYTFLNTIPTLITSESSLSSKLNVYDRSSFYLHLDVLTFVHSESFQHPFLTYQFTLWSFLILKL